MIWHTRVASFSGMSRFIAMKRSVFKYKGVLVNPRLQVTYKSVSSVGRAMDLLLKGFRFESWIGRLMG